MKGSPRSTSEVSTYVLDASAWIEYVKGTSRGAEVRRIIDGKQVLVSSYTVLEVAIALGREGRVVEDVVRVLLDRALVHHLSSTTAANAAQFFLAARSKRPKFSGGDAVVVSTADELGFPLVTCDNDFTGLQGVIVVR